MSRKNKYLIAYLVIIAAIIGYGILFCSGAPFMEKWVDSDQAFIIPIGILTGIGFFISQDLWEEIKKEKKK